MNTIIATLLFITSFSCTLAQPPCKDDPFYTFGRFTWIKSGQEIETIRTCAWLTANADATSIRIGKWCAETWKFDVQIKNKCPETCGECDSSDEDFSPVDPVGTPNSNTYCRDTPNWSDESGPAFDCQFYAEGDNCNLYGHHYSRLGQTANEACCACGGGVQETCSNQDWWYDSGGPSYNCEWYEDNPQSCGTYGANDDYENFGLVAQQACCVCGGGSKRLTRNLSTGGTSKKMNKKMNEKLRKRKLYPERK